MPKYKTTHVPPPKTPRGCPYARPDTPPTPPARTASPPTHQAATPPMPEPHADAAPPPAPPSPPVAVVPLPTPVSPSAARSAAATARPPLVVGELAVYTAPGDGQEEWHVTVLALDGVYAKVKAEGGPRMKVPHARLRAVLGAVAGGEGDGGGNAEVVAATEGGA